MDTDWTRVQEFRIGWNSHATSLLQMFSSCLDRGQYLDIDLVAEGRHVKVHSLALMYSSPYLKELIVSQDVKPDVLFLDGIPFDDVMALIQLIYKGEVNLGEHQITSFLDTAEYLQIQGIQLMKKDIESAPKPDSIEPCFQEEDAAHYDQDIDEDAALYDQDIDEDMDVSGESGSEDDESPYISFVPTPKGPLELNFEEEVIVIKGDPADDQVDAALPQEDGLEHADAQPEAENVDMEAATLPALPGPDHPPRRVRATSLKKKKGKRRQSKVGCLLCKLAFRGKKKLRRHLMTTHKFTEDWQLDIMTRP